jgi:hypothetical protein
MGKQQADQDQVLLSLEKQLKLIEKQLDEVRTIERELFDKCLTQIPGNAYRIVVQVLQNLKAFRLEFIKEMKRYKRLPDNRDKDGKLIRTSPMSKPDGEFNKRSRASLGQRNRLLREGPPPRSKRGFIISRKDLIK